jgi:hypothetical protein
MVIHGGMRTITVAVAGLILLVTACAGRREAGVTPGPLNDPRPKQFVRYGELRVIGDVEGGGPCAMLAPSLNRALKGRLMDCKYVALEFSPTGRKRRERVFDLWLVSGPTSDTEPDDHPVVDFYERVTLGEVGTTASGTFRFTKYMVDGQSIVVLDGPGRPR